jgi:hypothetical protein
MLDAGSSSTANCTGASPGKRCSARSSLEAASSLGYAPAAGGVDAQDSRDRHRRRFRH